MNITKNCTTAALYYTRVGEDLYMKSNLYTEKYNVERIRLDNHIYNYENTFFLKHFEKDAIHILED